MDMAPHVESPTTPAEYTRLHITPLNPDLLTTIIPPAVLPSARNISYATIQTFPEKSYGFVDLPVMEAEKLKKKLNGSTLKGTKIRIEKSRPKKEMSVEDPEEPVKVRVKRPKKDPSRKRKRDDETVPGIEIGDRHVKRGWTTPTVAGKSSKGKEKEKEKDKDKDKRKTKSKYTTDPECLFKTILPPNIAANVKYSDVKLEQKKRIKAGAEAVVHEFSKSTKYATFLRDSSGSSNTKGVAEFVEGKGWVDEEGNVVEQVAIKPRKVSEPKKAGSKEDKKSANSHKAQSKVPTDSEGESSNSEEETSSDSSSSEDESDHVDAAPSASKIAAPKIVEDSDTSTSGSSSEDSDSDSSDSSDSSDMSEDKSDDAASSSSEDVTESNPVSRPQSSSNAPAGLSIKIPAPETKAIPINTEVHPLEALYKKPKIAAGAESTPKPTASSFSFFGDTNGDIDVEEETHDRVPTTPFTQRDFEYRGIRSAAPTPDTAHANKRFLWPSSRDDEEDDEDEEMRGASSPIRGQVATGSKPEATEAPESDFQKWFYEHRGDTNRAWKKRRKIVGKEKRHRDNKKRQDRAI